MSQIELFQTNLPSLPNLARLSKFLGKPFRGEDNKFFSSTCWGKLGGTELKIIYDKEQDNWTIVFHIFSPSTSYRKTLSDEKIDIVQSWLDLNTDFIMENMQK